MLAHVGARAEQPLFLPRPEGDADGASGLGADGLEDAHGFERDGDAGGVVAGVGAGVPRVEVRAQHHDFVREVGARNLAHQVLGLLNHVADAVADLHLDLDREAALEDAVHPVVVLRGHGDDGGRGQHAGARPAVVAGSGAREAAHGA